METKRELFLDRVLRKFCNPELYEGIQGDLQELYDFESKKIGHRKALNNYRWRILGFFRTSFSKKIDQIKTNIAMWRNFLTITLRNIKKHKSYAFINVFGLAIGLAAGFIILQHVYYESTYDEFFENKENIYRVQTNRYNKGELTTQWASGCAGAGYTMKQDFPEVIDFVNLRSSAASVSYQKNYFQPEHAYFAGNNFFEVFSIPLISGIDSLVLKDVNTVVLSESYAKKIFGDEDPVGQYILQNDETNFLITGVFKDLPEKSHMKFDLLYSFETYASYYGEQALTEWYWDGFYNYIVLRDGVDPEILESKFPDWIIQRDGENLKRSNSGMEFILQPLQDIHLTSNFRGEMKPTGDKTSVYFLLIIGLFVLVIAWINYINLTIARSFNRAKEVGIRKVLGSFRSQLLNQFMFESSFLNILGLVIAILLILISFPYFNDFVGRSTFYTWPDAVYFWVGLSAVFLIGILLSGFYPAVVMTNFKPVQVLKGKFSGSSKGNLLRKGLVVFQFLASIVLITGTFAVYKQLNYLQNQNLGFKLDETLLVSTPDYASDSVFQLQETSFKNAIKNESFITDFSISSVVPGRTPNWNAGGLRLVSQTPEESNQYRVLGVDENYIDFYNLELVAGRKFSSTYGTESQNILINESAVKRLGYTDPNDVLNEGFYFWDDTFKIVGVLKDYRQESPKSQYDAYVFRYYNSPNGFYSIRLNTRNMQSSLKTIENHWYSSFGDKPLDYFFLNDYYNEQYKAELRFGSIFSFFSGLAILVACLGLFGLASYMTSIRAKEVGVRKVLGASFSGLLLMLTKDFLKLVGIAILISIPISWWLTTSWLENFAERIGIGIGMFLIPAGVLIAIATLTISYHTYFTANLNPAKTLKDE